MPSNLKSRLERIARGIGEAVGRWIIVGPSSGDDQPIERVGPHGENLRLRVPDGECDPMARLSDEQRAEIRPGDRVIAIRYTDTPGGADADA
jgi:hypothetical protein